MLRVMKTIKEIFEVWPTHREFARELGIRENTVSKWYQRGSIPPERWPAVMKACRARRRPLSLQGIFNAHFPPAANESQPDQAQA